MKKLFFYSNIDYDNDAIGITKKVKGQVKAFRELGYDVYYSCYDRDIFAIMDGQNDTVCDSKKNLFYWTKLNHAFRRFGLMSYVRSWLKTKRFDVVYLRYHYFDKFTLDLLRAAQGSAEKVIMEMHSYPCLGHDRLLDKVFTRLEKKYQEPCLKEIDMFANMSSRRLPFSQPQIEFRNTIDPESISVRQPLKRDGILHMLSVAYERPAHGFDRVLRGLADYYKNGGTQSIKIVFAGKYMDSTKQFVKDNRLEEICQFVPPVSGQDLDNLYDRADIAIGHLANHRVNSFAGSAIKTQEFLAKGIPFIYAWEEAMLPPDYPYALKFELSEEPVNIEKVVNWWKCLGNTSANEIASEMNSFFRTSAGWRTQMKYIVDAIDK